MEATVPRRRPGLRTLALFLLIVSVGLSMRAPSAEAAAERVRIATTSLPDATVGTAYSHALQATGGLGSYSWSLLSGTLPAGLSLSASGVLSGTPTTVEAPSFRVRVRDTFSFAGNRHRADRTFTLVVNDAPLPPPPPEPPPPPPPASGAPMTTANRTSGVAPLGVFFDAVDTTSPVWQSGVVQPSGEKYATFQYEWDFGDPASGTWTTTGNSRNAATGYTAAHVFESPGTYTVSLKVTDPASNVSTYVQTITVTAISGTVHYVDAVSGNDSNDGLTPSTAWRTVAKGFASGIATNASLLFKRGQTHTSTGATPVQAAGPGIIGAYGTGAKPTFQITDATGPIALYNSDWRIMDLNLVGVNVYDATAVDFYGSGQRDNHTLLRLDVSGGFRVSIGWANGPETWQDPHDGNVIADCVATNSRSNGMFIGGQRLAVIGTRIEGVQQSHVLRVWEMHKGVISNCVLRDPGPTRIAIKLHSPPEGTALRTKFVTINDNIIRGVSWAVTIAPQDSVTDERVTQVVFERNVSESQSEKVADVMVSARYITIRNNLFLATGSGDYTHGVIIQRQGAEPTPQYIDVYNNTMYRADNGTSFFTLVQVNSSASDVNVRNNLASAPAISDKHLVFGSCTNLVVTNNLLTDAPGWVNAAAGDFHLTSTSPALDAGATLLEVWEDLERNARPNGAAHDLGAFER
jgi:hypothetical protein